MQATLVTWALVGFGVVTLIPLFVAQVSMLTRPDSEETRNLLIGKGGLYGNVLRIAPPLTVSAAEVDQAADIIAAAIAETTGSMS